jgi:hypothetical protein
MPIAAIHEDNQPGRGKRKVRIPGKSERMQLPPANTGSRQDCTSAQLGRFATLRPIRLHPLGVGSSYVTEGATREQDAKPAFHAIRKGSWPEFGAAVWEENSSGLQVPAPR